MGRRPCSHYLPTCSPSPRRARQGRFVLTSVPTGFGCADGGRLFLITTAEELEERGIGLVSLTESIDTTTPGGMLVLHVFGAIAHDAERVLMRSHALYPERTAA
jgi:hypothetical protein